MARKKLIRFAINAERKNIIEEGKEIFHNIKGKWNEYFKNHNPIVLELGCGKGEYTTGLASKYPDKNFIGVDIKGSRIWTGSTYAEENNLQNVAFLRIAIHNLDAFFLKNEIDEIWITFPDPRMKDKDEKRRLTSLRFLNLYKSVLKKNGKVHLKTDSIFLYEYTKELLGQNPDLASIENFTEDLYRSSYQDIHLGIKTTFEKRYLDSGKTIKYLNFKFNEA